MVRSRYSNLYGLRKKTLAQHEKKRGIVKFTSQIDKTIFNVKEQIETIEQFIKEKNLIDK